MRIKEAIDFLITDTLFYGFSVQLNTDSRLKLLMKIREAINNKEQPSDINLEELLIFIDEYKSENEAVISSYNNSYKQSILSEYPESAIKSVKDYIDAQNKKDKANSPKSDNSNTTI